MPTINQVIIKEKEFKSSVAVGTTPLNTFRIGIHTLNMVATPVQTAKIP